MSGAGDDGAGEGDTDGTLVETGVAEGSVAGDGLTLAIGPADAARLADLHASAFPTPWDAEALGDLLEQPGVFAVRHVDGFILCRTVVDEAEILTLAVRPDGRGAGLGGRLVGAAAGLAREAGAKRLFLEVAEDNAAARAVYDGAGFAEVGRRRGYYARADRTAVDALLLSLNLA